VNIYRDLVCRQLPGFRSQAVDLYIPDASRAVCVYLHGGGWRVGSRRAGPGPLGPSSGRLFERMAAAGLLVCSTDYRLSSEAKFPAQLDDIRAAIDWVRARPEAIGLPLVVFGVSAGGNMALLVAALGDVQAVAAWYPPTDLLALPNDLGLSIEGAYDPQSREAQWLGVPAVQNVDRARAASPHHQSSLSEMPPVLVIHGDADTAVPFAQSVRYCQALEAAGTSATLETVSGYDHMFSGMADAEVDALVDRTVSFLLQGAAAP
jgi:acetyl esterase/lipase